MELLSARMGGNDASSPTAVSYSRSDAKMARNRMWPNWLMELPRKKPGTEVTRRTWTSRKKTPRRRLKMRSSGQLQRFRKAISCVRNSRSRRFAATPVSPSRTLKKSCVQTHCDHSSQSSSIRLADEITTWGREAKQSYAETVGETEEDQLRVEAAVAEHPRKGGEYDLVLSVLGDYGSTVAGLHVEMAGQRDLRFGVALLN